MRYLATLLVFFISFFSYSQLIAPFNARYTVNQKGSIRILSNVSVTCNSGSACTSAKAEDPPNGASQNGNFTMEYLDIDGSSSTFMSSSDSLNLANCSEVLWAGLYWAGRITNATTNYSTRNRVKIKLNNGTYQALVADELLDVPSLSTHPSYFCFKNITSIVQAGGAKGRYTVADVVTQTGGSNLWGNWSIVVVYKNVFQTMRNLTVFDGFANVNAGNSLDIPISGFLTPPSGPVSFELGVISYEGDRGSTGDQLQFNGSGSFINISDALHPVDDFFNSAISYDAVLTPFRNPNYDNSLALDANVFIPNNTSLNYIGNNVGSATIRVTTSSENILARVLTSAIDIFEPDLRADVRIKDINGGQVQPGDILEYTVVGKNIGSDLSINTFMVDTLDVRTAYVPGSISISYGPNSGAKTDASNDDQAEYISSSKVIRVRVGTGANSSSGGLMQASSTGADSTVLKFKVTILNDCVAFQCDPTISNSAYIYGTGNISGNEYNNGGISDNYNSNGCPLTASNELSINVASCPPVIINSNNVCVGQQLSLSTNSSISAVYTWNGPSNFTATGTSVSIPNVTTANSGTYTVTISVPSLGCSLTASKVITVNSPPVINLVNLTNVSCFNASNGSIQISASGSSPFTYLWSNNSTSTTISNLSPNTYSVTVTDIRTCTSTASYTITQPTVLTATANVTSDYNGKNISCFSAADGTALVTYSGGTAPYSISWSNGATTAATSGLAPGTYIATITDAKGCVKTASVTLTQPTIITLTDTHLNIGCFGQNTGSINLSAFGGTPGYIYTWSNGATTEDLSNLVAGTYTVTVKDLNNCTKNKTITITQPSVALALTQTSINVNCFADATGSINLNVSGGSPNYSYLWSNNATTQDLTGIIAGTYSVVVTDNNQCTQLLTATITEPLAPLSSALIATNVACFGNSNGSINLSPFGGTAPYTFLWSTNTTTEDVSNLLPGSYSVTIKDAKNCTATNNAIITQPLAPLTASTTKILPSCFGAANGSINLSVQGGTVPFSYSWTNGYITEDISNVSAGVYNVLITDLNGCTFSINDTLSQPSAAGVIFTTTDVLCFGNSTGDIDATVLGGTAPYIYSWSNGATTEDISNIPAGTYVITATDSQNCQLTSTVNVTQPQAALQVTETHTDALCVGAQQGTIDLTISGGTGNYTISWNNNASTEDVSQLVAGTYTANITDENNCLASIDVTILDPSNTMVLSETHQNVTCYGLNNGNIDLNVTGGALNYSYDWSNNAISQDLNNLPYGNYFVTVTDGNSCQSFISATITEPQGPLLALGAKSDVLCYGETNGAIAITTTGGTLPYTFSWSNGATTEDISGLTTGFYGLIVIDSNNCVSTYDTIIYQPLDIVIGQAVTDVRCFGGNDGALNMTPAGGIAPYTYSWNTGATTQDLNNLATGVYTLTVRDVNQCVDSLSVFVDHPSAPITITQFVTNVSCRNGSDGEIRIVPSGGNSNYTFLWNTGESTAELYNLSAGTYTVTVKDLKNCSAIFSIVVTQPATALTLSNTFSPVICHGDSTGTATVVAAGGTSPYSYLWNNGATTAIASHLHAGNYSVVVTDANYCTATISVTVTEPTALFASADSLDVLCYSDLTGSVSVFTQGGVGNYTYLWNSGQTSNTVNNLPAGNYSVLVKDGNQCEITATTIVNQPDTSLNISLLSTDNLCIGYSLGSIDATATGGTAPYTYLWSDAATTEDIDSLGNGNYILTVIDAHNCSVNNNTNINSPTQILATAVITNVSCFGGNTGRLDVSANGGVAPYSYLWNNLDTTQDVDSLIVGTYNVQVSDSNNCQENFSFTISQPQQALTLSLTQTNVDCFGNASGAINLTATGGTSPYTYNWSNTSTFQDISGLILGDYYVIVTDNQGCIDSISTTVTQPEAPIALTETHVDILCFGASTGSIDLEVTGGTVNYTYNWNAGFATSQDLTNIPFGTYKVIVKDANNCKDSLQVTLTQPLAPIDIQFVVQDVLCFGDSTATVTANITGGTSPYNYVWNTGDSTLYIDSLPIGVYTFTVIDSNQCSYFENINVGQPVAPLSATYNAIQPLCFGYSDGKLIANPSGGTAPYTYSWSNVDFNQTNDSLARGNYDVTITDAHGCTFLMPCTLTEPPLLGVSFDVDVLVGCSPLVVHFTNTSETNNACMWQFGDGNVFTQCDSVFNSYQDGGIYDVTLTASDVNGCTNSVTYDNLITVYQSPTAGINADPTLLFQGGDITNITNQSVGAEFYIWNMGDSPIDFYYFEPGNYQYPSSLQDTFMITLIAISSENCPDTAYQLIRYDNVPVYYVPNTFIPDGNGTNEIWYVVFSDPAAIKKFQVQIFDRWGELIYQSTDFTQGWDGTYLGTQLPTSDYWFTVE
ncbi:MAG: hypothetical protein EBS86_01340, partial [Crocinitomicaceae bacterium]|nr:hypothetical protein [Crocinitomicaceae bacterium]